MRIDGEPENPEAGVEIVLPDRVFHSAGPLLRISASQMFDQHIDVGVVVADSLGEAADLVGIEMVDSGGDAGPAELRDQLGGLLIEHLIRNRDAITSYIERVRSRRNAA